MRQGYCPSPRLEGFSVESLEALGGQREATRNPRLVPGPHGPIQLTAVPSLKTPAGL